MFLSVIGQKCTMKLQKSFLTFEQLTLQNGKQKCLAQMNEIKKFYGTGKEGGISYDETEEYQEAEQEDERLDTEIDSIAQQIAVIDQIISTCDQQAKNGIKSTCGLTLAGG